MTIQNEVLGWCAGANDDARDVIGDPCATPEEAIETWLAEGGLWLWRDRQGLDPDVSEEYPEVLYLWRVERPNHLLRGEDHAHRILEMLGESDEVLHSEVDWPPDGEAGRRPVEGSLLAEILYTPARQRLHEAIETALLDYMEAETGTRGVAFWIAEETAEYVRGEDGRYREKREGDNVG